MTLLRDGLKMGGAYFMADSLMRKHNQGSPAPQPQQQQPVYVQQPVQYGPPPMQYGQPQVYYGQQPIQYRQQPSPSGQQSGTYSRQIAAATPPPYSDDQSQQRSTEWVGQDGYLHANYCLGTCGGRCNGPQNTRSVDSALGNDANNANNANNANRSQSSFQPERKS